MARNFDLNKLPVDDAEEEMPTQVIGTSFPFAKRKVPELESCGLNQAAKRALKVVDLEMFIAESVYTAPLSYAARAGPRPGARPAGLIPYQPPARYPMQRSSVYTANPATAQRSSVYTANPATAQRSSNQTWGSGSSPGLHDSGSSTNEPARRRIG